MTYFEINGALNTFQHEIEIGAQRPSQVLRNRLAPKRVTLSMIATKSCRHMILAIGSGTELWRCIATTPLVQRPMERKSWRTI